VLEVCKQYKLKDACAYLYVRSGAIIKAFEIYSEVSIQIKNRSF